MEHYFYNFSTGVDVFNSLNELQMDHDSISFLISAVGDLSTVSFKCPLNQKPVILNKKLEIISFTGYLKPSGSHMHISYLMKIVVYLEDIYCQVQLFLNH